MDKHTAGIIGGYTNYFKHGAAHMREIGKLGGRPRKNSQVPGVNLTKERRYLSETTEKGMTPRKFREQWRIKS
jgi:hypothetical protein